MDTYPVAQRRRPAGREKKEREDGAEASDSEKLRLGFCSFLGRLYVGEESRESPRGKGVGLRGGALGRVCLPTRSIFSGEVYWTFMVGNSNAIGDFVFELI